MTVTLALLLVLPAGYVLLLAGLVIFQRRLLFKPDRTLPNPRAVGLDGIEVIRLEADDGASLLAWYAAPARADGPVVLYLHGNAGSIANRANRLRRMTEIGWGVFLLEYRGFGGNPGQPGEPGLRRDARAGLAALGRMGIAADRTLLWGESLGSGLAIGLAGTQDVAAVLLESPYTSIAETAQVHYPYVPARWLVRDKFDSLARIGAVRAPILIMQGARDRIVPPEMGRRLMRAATAPVELWVAPEAGHNDLAYAGATEAAADFVRRRLGVAYTAVTPSPVEVP